MKAVAPSGSAILDQVLSLKGPTSIAPKENTTTEVTSRIGGTPAPSVEATTLTAPPLSETPATAAAVPRQCVAGRLEEQAELAFLTSNLLDRIEEKLFGEKEEVGYQAAEPEAALSTRLHCNTYNSRINVTRLEQILEAI